MSDGLNAISFPEANLTIARFAPHNILTTVPTKICPCMEQLYFELEDKEHVFQIGIKTILECILFAAKEKQVPNLPLSWYTEVCSRYGIPLSELFGED